MVHVGHLFFIYKTLFSTNFWTYGRTPSHYYGKHVEDRRAEIWHPEVRSSSHYHISPLTSDYPSSVLLIQYGGLPFNVPLRLTLTWYLLVTDEFRKHASNIDFKCTTTAHQIPFVSANIGGRFPLRILHHPRLSKNMMSSLLHLCKVETGQENEVELYRAFKFKKKDREVQRTWIWAPGRQPHVDCFSVISAPD